METAGRRAARPVMDGPLGRPAMARTLAYFYLAGATLGLGSLFIEHPSDASLSGIAGVAAVCYLAAAVLYLRASRLPEPAIPGFLAVGTLLITAAIVFDGRGSSVYALFYVWVGVEAF